MNIMKNQMNMKVIMKLVIDEEKNKDKYFTEENE